MHYKRISEPFSVSVICWPLTDTQRTVWSQSETSVSVFNNDLNCISDYICIITYECITKRQDTKTLSFYINFVYFLHRKVLPKEFSRFLLLSRFHLSHSMYTSYTHFWGNTYFWFRISGHQKAIKSNVHVFHTEIKLEFKITWQTVPWRHK